MTNLITITEAKTLGRPIGKVADNKMQAIINEVENTIIRPSIGDSLFMDLISETFDRTFDYTFNGMPRKAHMMMLLDGGKYNVNDQPRMFAGLKVAEAYFVYAQNVMSGDFESTRYGMVVKNGEYSDHISSKERSDIYNNATATAKAYLNDCLRFCHDVGLETKSGNVTHSTTGCIIHKVGGRAK